MTLSLAAATAEARSPRDRAAATAKFESGRAALEAGDHDKAIADFTDAMALHPSPELFYAIGRANEKKGDYGAARVFYERVFEARRPPRNAVEAATAGLKRLDELARLGRIVLKELPEGASVLIDGERVALEEGGVARVPPGEHTVRVDSDAHEPFEQVVAVAPGGDIAVTFDARVAAPTIHFVGAPDGSVYALNGREGGAVPGFPLVMAPGSYEVAVRADGHRARAWRLELGAGAEETLEAGLAAWERPHDTLATAGWITLGVAGAAALGGGIATGLALDQEASLRDAEATGVVANRSIVQGEIDAKWQAAYATFALAGAGVVTATVLLVLGAEPDPEEMSASVAVTPVASGAVAGVAASF